MSEERKFDLAGRMLDKLVSDYRDDMAKWSVRGNEHAEKWVDAQAIAAHMVELARARPEETGWLLTLAIQRLGDAATA
jgi:hypothetical protein